MAFTRKWLSAMGIESAQVDEIINGHLEVLNPLKEERDRLKDSAGEVETLRKQVSDLQKENETLKSGDWQKKYEDKSKELEDYKTEVANEKVHGQKVEAFKEILKDIGITDEKAVSKVIKYSDIDKMELDDKGKLVDMKDIAKATKEEWPELIPKIGKEGADTKTPPDGKGGNSFESMSLADKMVYANDHPDDESVKAWLKK